MYCRPAVAAGAAGSARPRALRLGLALREESVRRDGVPRSSSKDAVDDAAAAPRPALSATGAGAAPAKPARTPPPPRAAPACAPRGASSTPAGADAPPITETPRRLPGASASRTTARAAGAADSRTMPMRWRGSGGATASRYGLWQYPNEALHTQPEPPAGQIDFHA